MGGSKANARKYTATRATFDIAQEGGQYPDIAWKGDFQLSFDSSFDPTFNFQVTAVKTLILYIVALVTFTCGIEFLY